MGALRPTNAQMAPVFGPTQYNRGTGAPQTFTDTFLNCETAAQYNLVVVNGNPDGTNRVSSATIRLNGTQVADPRDFNQSVSQITKPVAVSASNTLETTLASAPGSFLTVSFQCARNCLSVEITAPISNASPNVASLNVGGTVSSSADEVGVTVNAIPGLVLNEQFEVPDVPLALGTNIIRATATNACLNQATATQLVTVETLTPPAITLIAAPTGGVAPLTVKFTASISSANAITQYRWDFNGDGVVESSGPTLSQASNTYTRPGLYLATLTATDSAGNQFMAQTPIQVLSVGALTTLLQTRWSNLTSDLQSQNLTAALGLFSPSVIPKYQTVFTELGSRLPQIVSGFGNVHLFSEFNGTAELIAVRAQNGSEFVYFIYLARDQNGLWKFMSM